MVKVTLLGDSIRQIGYGKRVEELLGSDYEVFQPEDNCRFAKYTLRGLFDWKEAMAGSRIVHWNNGLWDVCDILGDGKLFTGEEEYLDTMLRIADILLQNHEKVIFATTTPVDPKNPYNRNPDIERYNAILVPQLQKKGVVINDLYRLIAADIPNNLRQDDLIHLTDPAIELAAWQVAECIRQVAAEP